VAAVAAVAFLLLQPQALRVLALALALTVVLALRQAMWLPSSRRCWA
jgi:hypothetical protein